MEYLQPSYACSAASVTLLVAILLAATIKRKSWRLGYISLIIVAMAIDKWTSLWSLSVIIADGVVYKPAIIARLVAKEVLYSLAFFSFFMYLLSDYAPEKVRFIIKRVLKSLSDNAEKW